jgi:hypothetical protein
MVRQKIISLGWLVAILISVHTFSGCALFPLTISPGVAQYQQQVAEADIPELAHNEDIINAASQVGESLGYEVSLKTPDAVLLTCETLDYIEPVTGKYQSTKIIVYREKSGIEDTSKRQSYEEEIFKKITPMRFKNDTVHLAVYAGGVRYDGGIYYEGDSQEYVNRVLAEFKNKLLSSCPTN